MAVYFPHVLVSGHSSLIHVRLTNNQAYSLESIETTVETRGLAQPVRRKWPRIAPGQTRTEPLEIEPARPGRYVLRLTVSFEMGGQRYSCRGTHSLGVNQEPESHNISINIGDIQSSTGGGSNSNLGAEYGNVQISNLLGGANIRTLNELLDFVFPEKYVPVKMDLDYELSVRAFSDDANARRKGLLIPGPFLGHVQPGDYCVLRSTSGEERELRLVSRPALKLGRARADADYVTWFWPRSGLLDERTRRISKVHTSLAVSEQGILVWDEGTPNGTTLDGQPVGKKEIPGAISQRGLVMLGAEYGVTIEHQASAQPSGPCVKNEQHWPGPPLAAQPPVMSGAVKFSPEEGSASPFSAVWLLTDASFGTSGSNTVVLADIALDEIQGRFHHYRGCFWVENSVANRAVAINGQTLTSGAMAPLSSGMELRIGGQAWRVEILST